MVGFILYPFEAVLSPNNWPMSSFIPVVIYFASSEKGGRCQFENSIPIEHIVYVIDFFSRNNPKPYCELLSCMSTISTSAIMFDRRAVYTIVVLHSTDRDSWSTQESPKQLKVLNYTSIIPLVAIPPSKVVFLANATV